jgi:hypothetical protein
MHFKKSYCATDVGSDRTYEIIEQVTHTARDSLRRKRATAMSTRSCSICNTFYVYK